METHCGTPIRLHPLAKPFSPSGCTIFAIAAGEQNIGSDMGCPSIVVLVSTSFTFVNILGRKPISLYAEEFRALVLRSVAAEE